MFLTNPLECMCTCYRRRRRSQVFVSAISQNPLVRIIRDFVCGHKSAWSQNENALVAVRRISRKWWPLLSKKNVKAISQEPLFCESDISRSAYPNYSWFVWRHLPTWPRNEKVFLICSSVIFRKMAAIAFSLNSRECGSTDWEPLVWITITCICIHLQV